jgi:hypothetical protein
MFKLSKSQLLLFLILLFAFLFRLFFVMWGDYPPGADIGLHNSIINSITQGGNTNFYWNFYHMGQGVSLTFPGYHIFVAYVILLTGASDIWAHAIVVSLFSALIVAVAFLITRRVWGVKAALIVSLLVALSKFDIEMLGWAGYPNVITLMLIPLVFYVLLQKDKFSLSSFLAVASLLSGAIFLTHSLSALIFAAIIFATFIVGTIFSGKFGVSRTYFLAWIAPLLIGAALISPFIVAGIPVFLDSYSGAILGGVSDIRLALLTTQKLGVDYLPPLIACVIIIFLLSKKYQRKFLSVPALLISVWILLPAMGTLGYLVGFYTDYSRFKYFGYLPFIMTLGLIIDFAADTLARGPDYLLSKIKMLPKQLVGVKQKYSRLRYLGKLKRLRPLVTRRPLYVMLAAIFIIYTLLSVSVFVFPPKDALQIQEFYQVMDDQLYQGIQWARNYTSSDSVFVADALYGWWFSGFAQRQTLSASDPQNLILPREIAPAEGARNLLDTDYIMDNGLIQVREDGGYINRHNPMFLAKVNDSYFPYGLFYFNSNETTILYRQGNLTSMIDLSQLPLTNMTFENTSTYASVAVTRGNSVFSVTEQTTIYQGVRYANMSLTLQAAPGVQLDWARFILHTKYAQFLQEANSVGLIDAETNIGSQIIFTENQPQTAKVYTSENPSSLELFYNLNGTSAPRIEMFVGVFQIPIVYPDEKTQTDYVLSLMANNTQSYMDKVADYPLNTFNYQTFLSSWNVSYVICRDPQLVPRFVNDPHYSLVFHNSEVSIFQVKSNIQSVLGSGS